MSSRFMLWTVLSVGCTALAGCDAIDAVGKPEPAPVRPAIPQADHPRIQPVEKQPVAVEEKPVTPPEPEPEPAAPARQEILIGFDVFAAGIQFVNRRLGMAFRAKYIVYRGDLTRPLKFVWEIRDGRNNVRRIPIEALERNGELQHVEPGVSPNAGPFSARIVCAQEPDGEFEEVCPWHIAP